MANTLDPMDLKQIITLHLDGYSNRNIGTSLGISRNTVNTGHVPPYKRNR